MFYKDIDEFKMLNKLIELGTRMWEDQGGV